MEPSLFHPWYYPSHIAGFRYQRRVGSLLEGLLQTRRISSNSKKETDVKDLQVSFFDSEVMYCFGWMVFHLGSNIRAPLLLVLT
jgi:hypothetical protein